MTEFIDATVFLGMHHSDEDVRVACKNYFINRLDSGQEIGISYEQLGVCDDMVWKYERLVQDAYYPFMDYLHTIANFNRLGYTEETFVISQSDRRIKKLKFIDKLTTAMVIENKAILFTMNKSILKIEDISIAPSNKQKEESFHKELESLYITSLNLRGRF